MSTVVDEFVTILGFDIKSGAGAVLTKFSQGIESIAAKAKIAAVALVGSATAAGYFIEKSNSATAELYKLKDLTGLSAKALQDWGFAAEQAGGSAHDIQRDIINLEKALHPTMPGEYNEGLFQLLGPTYLQKYKNVKDVLYAVSEAIKGMPKGLALNYLAMAGISESSYHLLSKGKAGVDKLLGKGMPFALSDEQIEKAFKFDQAMKQVYTIIKNVGAAISSDLAPYLTKVLLKFEEWLVANRKIISSKLGEFISGVGDGFARFGTLIEKVTGFIGKLIPDIRKLIDHLSVKELTSDGVYLGLTALAASLLLIYGRVGLVAGAITGLLVLFNQLNDAQPGDRGWLGGLKRLAEDTIKLKDSLVEAFKPVMDFFKPLTDLLLVKPEELRPAKFLDDQGRSTQDAMKQGDSHLMRDMFVGIYQMYKAWSTGKDYVTGNLKSNLGVSSTSSINNSRTTGDTYVTVQVANSEQAGRVINNLNPNFTLQSANP